MGKSNVRSDSSKKADRKFEKKLQFYSKVRESVASLSTKKAIEKKSKSARKRQKKLKAYDLSKLLEYLPELKELEQPAAPLKAVNCKSRKELLLKEARQMMTRISDPDFLSDPLAAIHKHLQDTQPVPETECIKKSKDNVKKKKKKKKTKSSTEPQSMEM